VFWGKGQCGTCHMVHGKGGLSGPELTNIAGYRKTQSIIDALTKPYHKVYPPGGAHLLETPTRGEWRPVEVTTQDGRTVKGVLLNQDTHSLQIMGDDNQLHMVVRGKLRSVKVEPKSRMPTDVDKRLAPDEFKDLVAYLTRLGTVRKSGIPAAPAAPSGDQ
jgi:putative heme-binding domain-containing protein